MGAYSYFDNLEPESQEAEIWRFMPLEFFEDLIANQELHFSRADRFVISPFADSDALEKAKIWVHVRKHEYEVRRSVLAIG